ncbi:GGDEF domain-containing protein [Teredinibacter purpureus]|uniref:GGDEF domain-containing protein n=1 Tax=Teredinibacter purpureus TaxID=2731756 RepID=UPI0005F885C6|nr:GGDEF domain-containing protein [Teredinibacter purpureus]
MKIKTYDSLKLIALLLTITVIAGHYYLPAKRSLIHPAPHTAERLYGFNSPLSGLSATWIDKQLHYWRCDYLADHNFGCGYSIYWDSNFFSGIDISAYDSIEYAIRYEGPGTRIRFYMRNAHADYAEKGDGSTTKYMAMTVRTQEIHNGPVTLNLSEFNVADWWLKERDYRRQWANTEFSNITEIGVDQTQKGTHKTYVDKITLVGKWINTEWLLLGTVGFWLVIFVLEGLWRLYRVYRTTLHIKSVVNELIANQLSLEHEKDNLQTLYVTDPLTGIHNRAGITEVIHSHHLKHPEKTLGLMLLDLDHFKDINDTYGHDIGDQVLKTFATETTKRLHKISTVARWGGEEFIIVTPINNHKLARERLTFFADNIRSGVEKYTFELDVTIKLTVSMGLTLLDPGENFEAALKRTDRALYNAKSNGRNRVEYLE